MYYWLQETDSNEFYVISDGSNDVYEVIDGKASMMKMDKYQLSKFKPLLKQVKKTEKLDIVK